MNSSKEMLQKEQIPYFPFPEQPKILEVGGYPVMEYISPAIIDKRLDEISMRVDMNKFDDVIVNMNGGVFLFKQLAARIGYKKDPVLIEYHRPNKGFGAIVTTPVPDNYHDRTVLVVDDIHDSGGVLREIMAKVATSSEAVALVTKRGIPNQIQVPKLMIGLSVDNKWIGGCGMDLGIEGEGDIFRKYPGIVVKSG